MYNLNVRPVNNKGFYWHNSKKMWFKGYIFRNDEFLTGDEAVKFLINEIDEKDKTLPALRDLNGIFSFIYDKGKNSIFCVDRTRSFPIFYTIVADEIIISDDPEEMKVQDFEIDEDSMKIFLHAGYVIGDRTLIKDIYQLQAGECIFLEKEGLRKEFYHLYNSAEMNTENDRNILKKELTDVLNRIGDRLAISLKDKTPVIPLSSGYDSRLIAVMLKERGFENVLTYTYGRKDNPELELSKKTAEKLGYGWKYIEYNDDVIKDFLRSEKFITYYPFSSNYSSMFYLQEFFAVNFLSNIIPENSVIVPGHSGDFFAGSHLTQSVIESRSSSEITAAIVEKHFNMKKIDSNMRKFLKDSAEKSFKENYIGTYLDFENWDLKERQAKFIINSDRIYEFFGYEYRLPLMDSELMDFFSGINPEFKLGKVLYDEVLRENFFKRTGLNFENETNPKESDLKIQNIKNSIKKIIPKKFVDVYREKLKISSDIYFNIGVTDMMTEDLKNSGANIDFTGENRNSIIIQWYIHQVINGKVNSKNS